MRAFLLAACLVLSGTVFAASAKTPLPSVPLPPELDRVLRDYETSWAKKDAAGLARLFAEDGFVLQGGRPPIRGRAAIQGAYAGSGGPLSLRALAFAVEGPVGFIIGAYAPKAGEPDDGKFTLTLRKGPDGKWLIFSDMDNGSKPRPGPPPPSPTPRP